ncbi:hypothetical protein BX600DRAFT_401253 [Xylariales sp. PMI_506]|nr:hypothetical protein BX600DRAFT_401253 [Xylariales sp. PMI_506]
MAMESGAALLSLTPVSLPEDQEQLGTVTLTCKATRSLPRSCHACSRKKIRCDKDDPCSACRRAGKLCTYPAAGPRIRRSKRTIIADMASRISTLEKSLAEARLEGQAKQKLTGGTGFSSSIVPAAPHKHRPADELSEESKNDILVERGSSSQYFNDVILSRVIGEERDIQSVLSTSHTTTPHPSSCSPFNGHGILSPVSLEQHPSQFHPPKPLAVRLWNVYVDNVDGCSRFKLLHTPTDGVRIYSTIDAPGKASFENLALCFAVYFAATLSLGDQEAQVSLGEEKHTLLLRFKVGLEQAFAYGDFLDRPNITGLHALAVYLSALRAYNHGKGIWILNGLALRIGQSLGLHRDAKRFGLSPFQTEIRRRLWWHLLSRDSRAAEDYGLGDSGTLTLNSEVKLPLNVDDRDIYPEMKELPAARIGWTTMTSSLINIDIARAMQKLSTVISRSSTAAAGNEEERMKIINDVKTRVEERLNRCNPVIPHHRMTLQCARFQIRKLDFTTRLQCALLSSSGSRIDVATEDNLIEALEILEPRLATSDDMLEQFSWSRKAYPQYYVAMFVLWYLCVKPEGPSVTRAWEAIDAVFSHDLLDESTAGFGSKPAVLAALKTKALQLRHKDHKAVLENENESVAVNLGLNSHYSFQESDPPFNFADIGGESLELDIAMDEWPDWLAYTQDFE